MHTTLALKQANRENEWWTCSPLEQKYILEFIDNLDGKKKSFDFINSRGTKVTITGKTVDDMELITDLAKDKRRRIVVTKVPKHNGFAKDTMSDRSFVTKPNKVVGGKRSRSASRSRGAAPRRR